MRQFRNTIYRANTFKIDEHSMQTLYTAKLNHIELFNLYQQMKKLFGLVTSPFEFPMSLHHLNVENSNIMRLIFI